MAPHKRPTHNVVVSEKFRINSELTISNFLQDTTLSGYEFPPNLTNIERAWLHNYAKKLGLSSKSHGKEPNRKILISKPYFDRVNRCSASLSVTPDSYLAMRDYFNRFTQPSDDGISKLKIRSKKTDGTDTNMGQLSYGISQIPNFAMNNNLIAFRMELPIWPMRDSLMAAIVSNQVVIINGETGSGKTTQVPQFILDYSTSIKSKCRVICTQPRRISAVAMADRVASERGEKTGQTVGFHIRLESCVGPKTVLVYCTNGILLRTLMNGDKCLKSFTHIIVDEVHERDRFSDFLLICLRECLVNYPHLRLILMSATLDARSFQNYFHNAPVINVPGRLHPVTEYYLEDILQMTNYESNAMRNLKTSRQVLKVEQPVPVYTPQTYELNSNLRIEMTECIVDCIEQGTDEVFAQLFQLILSDHAPVDFQHPETGYNGLIAAAIHGNMSVCKELLNFGADPKMMSKENMKPSDWARSNQHYEVAELLKHYENYSENPITHCPISDDEKQKLDLYHSSTSDQLIDYDLLMALLCYIHIGQQGGSILVFLSGYDDIVTIKDRILNDPQFDLVPYKIFTLHSLMPIADQNQVFNRFPEQRKIILATNIAETSITIDDVVFVIDSGKVKQKCYDSVTGICSLQSTWISQACSKQRAGRGGRTQPGLCYHIFSKFRYSSMQTYSTPEILRMPLHELCLQTKLLAPLETKIANFLSRAIEPPTALAVSNAIKHLQEIGALDENEDLTILGSHLVDLPVEPRLAKILIYSVIFKCIDPVLTLVSFLSYRDPFILPSGQQHKTAALNMKKTFCSSTFSDHMIFLRAFQSWQEARLSKSEKAFCSRFFISSATMEMVINIRSQLLAQLRASGFVKTKSPGDIRDLNENSNNWAVIKAVLTAGFFPNIASINKQHLQIKTKNEKKVMIHTSSALRIGDRLTNSSDHAQSLHKIPTNWLVFEEISRTGTNYTIKGVTAVSSITVALFVDDASVDDNSSTHSDDDDPQLVINNWINLEASVDLIAIISKLREKISNVIVRRLSNPYKQVPGSDEIVIKLLVSVLQREDANIGFTQPIGIGNRPKIMLSSSNGTPSNYHQQHKHIPTVTDQQEQRATEILQFKPVEANHYNRFMINPQPNLINPLMSGPPVQTTYPMQHLTQSLDMLSMYPVEYNEMVQYQTVYHHHHHQQSPVFIDSSWDEFSHNGITVDLEGACALESVQEFQYQSPQPMYQQPSPVLSDSAGFTWSFHVKNPENTVFFIIKTGSLKAIDVSISKKTWIFSPQTERKILREFSMDKVVILVFTVQGSNFFHGVARLLGGPNQANVAYNLNCPVEWLSRADISMDMLGGAVTINCVDGDRMDTKTGLILLDMFTNYIPQPPVQRDFPPIQYAGRPITGRR